MGLTRFVLKRPVATVMALLCLLVFGISSVFNATLEQMPDTDQPMLIIIASYSGAGPEDIDELVTQPIEDQVGTIEGVKSMSSTSSENRAMIMLEYDYGTDMDDAYNDLSRPWCLCWNRFPLWQRWRPWAVSRNIIKLSFNPMRWPSIR